MIATLPGVAGALLASSEARADSGDWSSPGLATPEDPTMPKYVPAALCDQCVNQTAEGLAHNAHGDWR